MAWPRRRLAVEPGPLTLEPPPARPPARARPQVAACVVLDPPGLGELGRLLAGQQMKAWIMALQTLNVSEASPH